MHKVLLIEDDPTQSDLMARMLRRKGLEVECVANLEAGLHSARERLFGCVVLDPGLPDSSSMESVMRIPEFGETPVVVVTGSDDRDLIREVRRTGADYAIKSTEAHFIIEKVLQAIEFRHPSREVEEGILDSQRTRSKEERPWWQKWVPMAGFMMTVLGATFTGGAVLYQRISDDARQSQKNSQHFDTLDRAIVQIQTNMERMLVIQSELQMKAQTSMEDRAGLHREMGSLLNSQKELKEDVVRRLERIEDKIDGKFSRQ